MKKPKKKLRYSVADREILSLVADLALAVGKTNLRLNKLEEDLIAIGYRVGYFDPIVTQFSSQLSASPKVDPYTYPTCPICDKEDPHCEC